MPKYEVTLLETVKYLVEVEADSADEAEEMAAKIWADSEDPIKDFDGQGYGVEATHVYLNGAPQPSLCADNPFDPESPEGRAFDRGEMAADGSMNHA